MIRFSTKQTFSVDVAPQSIHNPQQTIVLIDFANVTGTHLIVTLA